MADSRIRDASDVDVSDQQHLLTSIDKRQRRRRFTAVSAASMMHVLLLLGIWFAVPEDLLKFNTAPVVDLAFSTEGAFESQFTDASPDVGTSDQTKLEVVDSNLTFEELNFEDGWPQYVGDALADLEAQDAENAGRVVRRLHSTAQMTTLEELYLNLWQRRVESVGTLNIPQELIDKGLEGRVVVLVRVNPDGSVARTDILYSDGAPEYGRLVQSIILLASPFPAFPEELAGEVDAVDVIRVWNFELR